MDPAGDAGSKFRTSAVNATLYRTSRQIENIRDLLVRKIFNVPQDEHLAVLLVKFGEGRLDNCARFAPVHAPIGTGRVFVSDLAGREVLVVPRGVDPVVPTVRTARPVESGVPAVIHPDTEHPGGEAALRTESSQAPERRHEYVLCDFLGRLGVAKPAITKGVDP